MKKPTKETNEPVADTAIGLFKAKIRRACDEAERGDLVDGASVLAKADALINQRQTEKDPQRRMQ
jgi:hypothetical protein